MTYNLILGNILSFIGTFFLALSPQQNSKKDIVFYQIFSSAFDALANFTLGGFSGTIAILASLTRNILIYKNKCTHTAVIIIMIAMIIGSLSGNRHGFIGILPIIANLEYTIWLHLGSENAKGVKLSIAINVLIWAVYDLTILAIPAFISDIVIFALTLYGIHKSPEDNKKAV